MKDGAGPQADGVRSADSRQKPSALTKFGVGAMFVGYVPFRRGILEHARKELTHEEGWAYSIVLLEADSSSGIWWGSSKALGPYNFSERSARHLLDGLHRKGYIKKFSQKGRRGNYPILINKYAVTRGKWYGYYLIASETVDWHNPVYRVIERGDVGVYLTGYESASSQEVRSEKRKKIRDKNQEAEYYTSHTRSIPP